MAIQSRAFLTDLAAKILALDIPERLQVHAEKMKLDNGDAYSLAFFETALHLSALLVSGYVLSDGFRFLPGKILAVKDIPYELKWGETFDVDKEPIREHAKVVMQIDADGPDLRIARRVLSKKATIDEWKLAALRFCDIAIRVQTSNEDLPAFLKDLARNEKEFADLRKNLSLVDVLANTYVMPSPLFPPWTDVGSWSDDCYDPGYREAFRAKIVYPPRYGGDACASEEHVGDVSTSPNMTQPAAIVEPVFNKQGLQVKDLLDVQWPSLPVKTAKTSPLPPGEDKRLNRPRGNVWTDRHRKKSFMNSGIANKHKKLAYSPPSTVESDYMIDIARAYSMHDIWGHALLGQYVGRLPGHHAIHTMIKAWGVRAKYRIEEGWLIFNFD